MNAARDQEIRDAVRERYGDIARHSQEEPISGSSCCGDLIDPFELIKPGKQSTLMGYSEEEIASVPPEAVLGLGCGRQPAGDRRAAAGRGRTGPGKRSRF
ncbi:MAG: hypothetical protein P8Y34_09700 [Anaerolineales bacterium]